MSGDEFGAIGDLRRAAFDVIDADGWRSLTVRSIGRRAFYAPGTVGYHIPNIDVFKTSLWQDIGDSLALALFATNPVDADADAADADQRHAADDSADRALAWSHRHPPRVQFFIEYTPSSHLAFGAGVDDAQAPCAQELTETAGMRFVFRTLQASLELLLAAPTDPAVISSVTSEFRMLREHWAQQVLLADTPLPESW